MSGAAGLRVRRAAAAFGGDRFFFVAVDLEDGVELGELEELLDALGGVDEDQLAVLGGELAEVADELTDAGGVDVVDLGEVDDDVRALVLEDVFERGGKELGALAELDQPFHVENREIVEMLLFYDHQGPPIKRARIVSQVAKALPRQRQG